MSTSGNDCDDFEAVAGLKLAVGKFGGRYSIAVVLDDDAARRELLGN